MRIFKKQLYLVKCYLVWNRLFDNCFKNLPQKSLTTTS